MCVPLLDVGEGCRCGASSVRPPNADGCEQRRRGCVATGAREDSELLLTLWVRSPVNAAGPRIRVATAGASGCLRRAGASRRSGSPRSRRAGGRTVQWVHLVQVPVRVEPRHRSRWMEWLSVRRSKSVQHPAGRDAPPPSSSVGTRQGVDHRPGQQLQDVRHGFFFSTSN